VLVEIGGIGGYPGLGGLGCELAPRWISAAIPASAAIPGVGAVILASVASDKAALGYGGGPWRSLAAASVESCPKASLAVVGVGFSVWQPTTATALTTPARKNSSSKSFCPNCSPQLLQGPVALLFRLDRWPPGRNLFSNSRMIIVPSRALPALALLDVLQHRAGHQHVQPQGTSSTKIRKSRIRENRAGDRDPFAACRLIFAPRCIDLSYSRGGLKTAAPGEVFGLTAPTGAGKRRPCDPLHGAQGQTDGSLQLAA